MDGDDFTPEGGKLPELKLDARQAQGFISFFKRLPQDYYTAHGENATFIAKTYYHTMDLAQDLGRIIRGSVVPVGDLLSQFDSALGALGALLSYAELLADDTNYGNYTIEKYNLNRYMRLDSAASCTRIPFIQSILQEYNGQFSTLIRTKFLDPLEEWMTENRFGRFASLVETAIDLGQVDNGQYRISPLYSSDLGVLKDELSVVEDHINSLHMHTASDLDLSVDKHLKLEKGPFGHVFRISKKEEQKIRKKLTSNYIIIETRKDGVKFTSSKLKKLGDQYQALLSEYTSCQKKVVDDVVRVSGTFSEVFENFAAVVSELDVLQSFADLATSCPVPYVRPDITASDEGDIILQGSRHPCLEAQDGVNFIPNDCTLLRGVSTFMQEMLETASILKGLAWAICEHLVEVTRAPTLFATHFHELTALAHRNDDEHQHVSDIGISNYHVGAHIDPSSRKLTMLYKVEPGACDQSFGIHVAEFANFPEAVVALAKSKAAELEDFSATTTFSEDSKDEVGSKRKRIFSPDDVTRGAARARLFLEELAALPVDEMDGSKTMEMAAKLKADLLKDAVDNPWLQQFV
nr:unnamed protein product [Digitaria exilis]